MARYDQSLADASAEVDRLLLVLQTRTAEVGEPQAISDVCALVSDRGTAEVAGLLAAALHRLAG